MEDTLELLVAEEGAAVEVEVVVLVTGAVIGGIEVAGGGEYEDGGVVERARLELDAALPLA